jgi:hypothetical protein
MMARVTDYFFAGDPAALVSHLVGEGQVSAGDLAEIKRLIAQLESGELSDG